MTGNRGDYAFGQLGWGLFLIISGLLLLLDRFHLFNFAQVFRLMWPVALIAVGIAKLVFRRPNVRISERQDNAQTSN